MRHGERRSTYNTAFRYYYGKHAHIDIRVQDMPIAARKASRRVACFASLVGVGAHKCFLTRKSWKRPTLAQLLIVELLFFARTLTGVACDKSNNGTAGYMD